MINDRYQTMTQALRQAGHRLTPQRAAICQYLAASREHPSPAAVFAHIRSRYPTISLATVYNTLNVLRELGEIVEMSGGAEGVRYETDPSPHANLICRRCGRIVDVPLAGLSELRAAIAATTDFDLHGLRLDGHGLCAACQLSNESEDIHA